MVHYCHFNKNILNPIKRSGSIGEGKKAYMKLQQQILDEILLRRTKTSRADDIKLPPRIVTVRQEKLDANEEDYYEALYTQSQAQFNTYVQSGTVLNNYAHIFDILIRLRQAVDHPYLVIHSNSSKDLTPLITNDKKRKATIEECDTVPDCGLCRGNKNTFKKIDFINNNNNNIL
jgi:DNA repair protein RAD16